MLHLLSLRGLIHCSKLFSQAEVTVTLQCSGTRRIEQIQEYPGDGDELINAVIRRVLTHDSQMSLTSGC